MAELELDHMASRTMDAYTPVPYLDQYKLVLESIDYTFLMMTNKRSNPKKPCPFASRITSIGSFIHVKRDSMLQTLLDPLLSSLKGDFANWNVASVGCRNDDIFLWCDLITSEEH